MSVRKSCAKVGWREKDGRKKRNIELQSDNRGKSTQGCRDGKKRLLREKSGFRNRPRQQNNNGLLQGLKEAIVERMKPNPCVNGRKRRFIGVNYTASRNPLRGRSLTTRRHQRHNFVGMNWLVLMISLKDYVLVIST